MRALLVQKPDERELRPLSHAWLAVSPAPPARPPPCIPGFSESIETLRRALMRAKLKAAVHAVIVTRRLSLTMLNKK